MKKFPKKFSLILTIALIGIVGFSITALAADSAVPDWIKNNAKWWSEGSISETDYIKSLEYLIINGIIQIPISEVTAAETAITDDERAQSFVVTFSDGLINRPFTIDTFVKFESTSSVEKTKDSELYTFPLYKFTDPPEFLLESLPSSDKRDMYIGIENWMSRGSASLTPFDVDIDVVSGDGRIIQTWAYKSCEPTAYGTFLQDVVFYYQFVDQDKSEIRERVVFTCSGLHLLVP